MDLPLAIPTDDQDQVDPRYAIPAQPAAGPNAIPIGARVIPTNPQPEVHPAVPAIAAGHDHPAAGVASLWSRADNIHNPVLRTLGKVGAVGANILDTIGSTAAPAIAVNIPGSTLFERAKEQRAEKEVSTEAETGLKTAQTTEANARANSLNNPKPDNAEQQFIDEETKKGKSVREAVQDYSDATNKGQPKNPLIHETDQGIFMVDPETRQATPLTYNGKPLMPKPATAGQTNDFEQYYSRWMKDNNQPDTAANRLQAHKDWEIRPVQPGAASDKASARLDKSYQYENAELDKIRKPIDDAVSRLGRLTDTIAQGTPQADALIAPELLTVMAGGQGSGLRMNEAEIARIVGGRSNWESLKASINKWQIDPSAARSITPAQDRQIKALVGAVRTKLLAKQKILDDASGGLLDAEDVKDHRRIVADTRKKLSAVDTEAGGDTIRVQIPGHPEGRISADQKEKFLKKYPNAKVLD